MKQSDIEAAFKKARHDAFLEMIRLHGKPIRYNDVVVSKKLYTRKKKHKNQEFC